MNAFAADHTALIRPTRHPTQAASCETNEPPDGCHPTALWRYARLSPFDFLGDGPPLARQRLVLLFDELGPVVGDPLAFGRVGAVFRGSQSVHRRRSGREGDTFVVPPERRDERVHVTSPSSGTIVR